MIAAPARAETPSQQISLAPAPGAAIMRTSEVKPGMKAEIWTVFFGTQPEPFAVELIDVMPDFRTGQDIVFFRALDPRVIHTGIVAGMSGSPVYVNGKLLGALAYGYGFNKDAIGGITPITAMLEVDRLSYHPELFAESAPASKEPRWVESALGLDTLDFAQRQSPREAVDPSAQLLPLGAAFSSSGLGYQASAWLSQTLGHYVAPASGAGGVAAGAKRGAKGPKVSDAPKKKWRGGDAMSVVYLAGDNSAGAHGTISWVGGKNGERLLAFGHPMNQRGPSQLPIADDHVHVIIPSLQKPFKVASSLTIQGTMTQDRQPAIAARTDIVAPLIPVRTEIGGPDGAWKKRTYSNFVAVDRQATPGLALTPLVDGLEEAASDLAEVVVRTHFKIGITTKRGPRTLEWDEEFYFSSGVSRRALGESQAFMVMSALLDNHFEIGQIREIVQTAQVEYGAPVEMIEEVRLASEDVRAGSIARLELVTRTLRGPSRSEFIDVKIPDDCGDESIIVHLAGGDSVAPYRPVADNVDDLIDTILAHYPERSLVVSVFSPNEGLASRHGLLDSLPGSVLESLSPSGSTRTALRFKRTNREVMPRRNFVVGEQRLEIDVLPALTRKP
jgi:hypothetical protein